MSAFTGDTLGTYGGAKNDYSPVVDPTVEMAAAEGNPAFAATAGMTRTSIRAWVRMTVNGTATPVLVGQSQSWAPGSASPVLAYSTTGTWTVTWPSLVADEIASIYPGYTGPTSLNLRAGWASPRLTSTLYLPSVNIPSANVAQLLLFNSSGALANPGSAIDIDVYVI